MRKPFSLLLSLSEPVQLIKERFREKALETILARRCAESTLKNPLNYDCVLYLSEVLKETFESENNKTLSLRRLVSDGLDKQSALQLSNDVFKCITDVLASAIPTLTFSNEEGYDFTIVGEASECDLMVTLPIDYGD